MSKQTNGNVSNQRVSAGGETAKTIGPVSVNTIQKDARLPAAFAQAEIDSQISTAKQYPRDIDEFINTANRLATHSAEVAAECFYKLPRAGGMIEGASVRLAEICLACFKNLVVQGDVSHTDGKFLYAVGTCRDLENNVAARQCVRIRIVKKDGTPYNEDMVEKTANAAVSKAIRNAIFRIIPKVYWGPIVDQCKEVAIGKAESLKALRTAAMQFLQKMGIDEPRVLNAIGKRSVEEIDRKDLTTLRGFISAIKQGEAELDTCFPEVKSAVDLEAAPVKKPRRGRKPREPASKPESAEKKADVAAENAEQPTEAASDANSEPDEPAEPKLDTTIPTTKKKKKKGSNLF